MGCRFITDTEAVLFSKCGEKEVLSLPVQQEGLCYAIDFSSLRGYRGCLQRLQHADDTDFTDEHGFLLLYNQE
jgi:hypothetical protein